MAFRIGLVTAQLEILLRPTRLQHVRQKLPVEIGDRSGVACNSARCIGRPTANLVDRAKGQKPDQTDRTDRHDLVGEAEMKRLAYREIPYFKSSMHERNGARDRIVFVDH